MQKLDIKTKKGITINFDFKEMKFKTDIVDVFETSDHRDFCKLTNSNLIDVAEFNNDTDIIVDDEGLLKRGNPIFEVQTLWGAVHLAGKLLFLKKEETNDGIKNVGMDTGECFDLIVQLSEQNKVRMIGVTA